MDIVIFIISILLVYFFVVKKEKKPLNNIEKGSIYEEYIANKYRKKGYSVWEHGKEMGRADLGIDLVATQKNKMILIQCKNWSTKHKYKITNKDIKAFRTDALDFLDKNYQYKNYDISLEFILSGDFIDKGAKVYINVIKKRGKKINYKIIKM